MRIIKYLLPLTLYCLLSCSDSSVNTQENTAVLLPLEIGNQWAYSVYDKAGAKLGDQELQVVDTIISKDNIYSVIRIFDSKGKVLGEWIALNKQDGLFLGTADSSKNIQKHLLFKFPASDGEIYEYKIPMKTAP